MSIVKIIGGLACLFIALLIMPFAWVSLASGILWFKFIPAAFTLGLIGVARVLIFKRRLPLSRPAKTLIAILISILIVSPIMLEFWIRGERNALQKRAKEFISRPVPDMLNTDAIDGYQARQNETVLSTSRRLIERYANNGRIRWSAAIQGQFAIQHLETAACEEAARTNEQARLYIVVCQAIIDKEWEMGYWQWVQDTIERKGTIPEIEEEDHVDRFVQQINGTWTNGSGTMTISRNGTFSAVWSSQTHTNFLKGTQVFRALDKVLMVYPDSPTGTSTNGEKDFRIIHVDDHNLIYEVGNQTNSMSR